MTSILRRDCIAPTALIIALTAVPAFSVQADDRALDEVEKAISAWSDAHAEEAIALIEKTVNIGSGTMNHEGVRKVAAVLRPELEALDLDVEWIELDETLDRAGHLVARRSGVRGPRILMIGHLDTVFEAGDAFSSFVRDGDTARGPGVIDMKSGNVVMIYALKALEAAGSLEGLQLTLFYSGDEEKAGRPLSASRADLIAAGEWADVALGFEAASFSDGRDWATAARRGSVDWRLEVEGVQAHSSTVFSETVGAGAIFEAARVLAAFYEELRGERYLTFNAGAILGGTDVKYDFEQTRGRAFGKTNVVPRSAVVHGGLRTLTPEQLEAAQEKMQAIVSRHLPRTRATLKFGEGYPPMAPTDGNLRLKDLLSEINVALGRGPMDLYDPSLRGAADISFVAPYTDALAGLGPIGGGSHSPEETIDLRSVPLAITRAAILIRRLATD